MKNPGFQTWRRFATVLPIIPLVLLLASCSLRLPVHTQQVSRTLPQSPPQTDTVPVWLISDSYHTGMVFPYGWLREYGFVPPDDFPEDTRHVAMSWGNRDAYSAQGLDSPGKWLRVLLTPTPSVMEMIPVNWNVTEVLPKQRIWIRHIERDRGQGIAAYLNACSRKNYNGRPVVVTASSWGNGVQLEGSHSYFIPRVCNVWTAQAIESLGYRINPWQGITADSLIRQCESPEIGFRQIWDGRDSASSALDP